MAGNGSLCGKNTLLRLPDPISHYFPLQEFVGHAKRAALIVSQSSSIQIGRYVIVVDEDIDPSNIRDVLWALCFRSDPAQDIDVIRNCRGSRLDPYHRSGTPLSTSIAIIDACKPYDRIGDFPAAIELNADLASTFARKWSHLVASKHKES